MRFLFRLTIVLGAIVIFSGGLLPRACAQEPATLFQKADQLEKDGKKQEALNEYNEILRNNQGKNAEAAAEALFRGGLYAAGKFISSESDRPHGEDLALRWWKQLLKEYPNSAAAKKLTKEEHFARLKASIDKRNSTDWKYQIIHSLVLVCGNNPSFSYGLALILLAVLVKLILLPLTKKQYRAMREMQQIQPLVKELQKKYKGVDLSQKQMELFKEHGVSPFASCLPTLLQLPFLILVFTAIQKYEIAFSKGTFLWVGSALSENSPKFFGHNVFGKTLADPDVVLLALYTITNYVTMKMTPATDPQQQQTQNTMAVMTSVIFFTMFLSYEWSSAFIVYWLALNLLSIWQQYEYIYKPHKLRQANGGEALMPDTKISGNGVAPKSAESASLSAATPPARVRPRRKKK